MNNDLKHKWNTRYQDEQYVYGTRANQFLRQSARLIPGGAVLCLGAGEGRNAVFLAGKGYRVTAIDISETGLDKTRRLAGKSGVQVETVCRDLRDFKIGSGAWQGIISIFCHIPSDLRTILYEQVIAGLAPGGLFILEAYTPGQLKHNTGGPSSTDLLVTLKELQSTFGNLELLQARERIRTVREGSMHTGKAAVVQLIAKK